MRFPTLSTLSVLALAAMAGCKPVCFDAMSSNAGTPDTNKVPDPQGGTSPTTVDGARLVAEADVVQLDDATDRIYALSRSGGMAIVDASVPGQLAMLGKLAMGGEPFEMYRRGDALLVLSNHAVRLDGGLEPSPEAGKPVGVADATSSAVLTVVDVSTPASPTAVATLRVAGEIADSRIVGDVLYLATYEAERCWGCGLEPRTVVTSFDVSKSRAPKLVEQVAWTSPNGATMNSAWATPWKRSLMSTKDRLYVGGLADTNAADEGVIEVLDITDPKGHLVRGARIVTTGPVMSRWQMDEHDGYFRVVSQRGAGRTANGLDSPGVDTFRIESSASMPHAGHLTMKLPRQEGLKTVRFDGPRAYAITYEQTDPLFTIDLSNPRLPEQKGELQLPGWVYHLVPQGDRLLGLGLDRTDSSGVLNVSLFDVTDLAAPSMLGRASFGPTRAYADVAITTTVLAEDQDRIQKAFRVFPDGLVVVPYSSLGYSGNACSGEESGVQLLEFTKTSLVKRGLLAMNGNPRRAIRRDSASRHEVIAVSDSNVRAFTIDTRDAPIPTADVVIGACVARTIPRSTPPTQNPPSPWTEGHGGHFSEGGLYDDASCYF